MINTNTNTAKPAQGFVKKTPFNTKKEAKRLLASGNCRGMLLIGGVLSAAVIGLSILMAYTIVTSSPSLSTDRFAYLAQGIIFIVPIFFIVFMLSPLYCGLYNTALKNADEENAGVEDLFKFYTSPELYKRSIRIFISAFWFILGYFAIMGAIYVVMFFIEFFMPSLSESMLELMSAISSVYMFSGIFFLMRRKKRFLFIPLAIDRTELSLGECKASVSKASHLTYMMYLTGDAFTTYSMTILSAFTVGILYILHVAPLAIAKKTMYYKTLKTDR